MHACRNQEKDRLTNYNDDYSRVRGRRPVLLLLLKGLYGFEAVLSPEGRGVGTPPYKLYRYVPPKTWFWSCFGLKMGHGFYHSGVKLGVVLPFGLKLGMFFLENHEGVSFHWIFHLQKNRER